VHDSVEYFEVGFLLEACRPPLDLVEGTVLLRPFDLLSEGRLQLLADGRIALDDLEISLGQDALDYLFGQLGADISLAENILKLFPKSIEDLFDVLIFLLHGNFIISCFRRVVNKIEELPVVPPDRGDLEKLG
jgi:hypothetical protein